MPFHRRLFFSLLLLLPTQLGIHFWPDWAYVLGRRVDYLSPTVYLTDILIVLILIVRIRFMRITKQFLLLVLFAGLNIFFAKSPWVAIYKWLKVAEFVGLGWYIVSTKPKFLDVTRLLSVGVLYSSVIAITQFILQRSIGGPLWFFGERTFDITTPGIARWEGFGRLLLRPYATFPHPNVLAGFLAVVLPLMSGVPLVLVVTALFLTFSRSAWFVAGLAIAFMQKKRPVALILALVFIGLAIWFRPTHDDESMVRRAELNQAAITMWRQNPIFGVGLGNFLVEGKLLQPVHNIYLLILVETGVIGLGSFLFLLKKALRSYHMSLIIVLLLGFVDHYPLTLQQGQLLLTLVAAFLLQ